LLESWEDLEREIAERRGDMSSTTSREGCTPVVNTTLSRNVANVVDQVIKDFHPRQIILFGSHATGADDEGSDVDLLIIMETTLKPIEQAAEISRALDHRVPTDLFVRTPDQITNRHPRYLLLRTVLQEGVVVYEAGD
jgi:predicted nucleotidyltransferase